MVNCCTDAAGIEQGALTVSYFTGKPGGGATSKEFVDNFMSSSLAPAIFGSMVRFSLRSVSKRIRVSTNWDWSGWDGGDGAVFFLLGLVENFFGLAPEHSECPCCSKKPVLLSMSSEKRNSKEDLDFAVDCLVDRGTIKGPFGNDCEETSTQDAKMIKESPQMTFGTSGDKLTQ